MSKEIHVEQGSPAWFELRMKRATASEAHNILSGKSTLGYRKYRAQLAIERVISQPIESYSNDLMNEGHVHEPVARLLYGLHSGNKVRKSGIWVHDDLLAAASPDGVVEETAGLEIKVQLPHIHLMSLLDDFIDSKYQKQMDFQMWITGFPYVDFASYSPLLDDEKLQFKIIRYERNEENIAEIEKRTIGLLDEVDNYYGRMKEL